MLISCHPGMILSRDLALNIIKLESGFNMDEKNYYIYILTNFQNNIFYVGVTSDLIKRVFQHKNKLVKGFTEKYNVYKLVYFELHSDINEAILVEKRLKKWKREFKIKLIEKLNPEWNDLYNEIIRF